MQIESNRTEVPQDQRFQGKYQRSRQRAWSFATGNSSTYLTSEEDIWPPNIVKQIETDEGTQVYVNYKLWPILGDDDQDLPSLFVPDRQEGLTYVPFYWDNPFVQRAQDDERIQSQINGILVKEAIPFHIFTPTLYLMLNGTPRKTPDNVSHTPYPKVISTLDVMYLYQLVETLFTTNSEKQDAKRIRQARTQFNTALATLKKRTEEALQELNESAGGDDYARRLFETVKASNGDTNSLASLDEDDSGILTRIASIYMSYQLYYLHAMEMFLIRLLMPSVDTRLLDPRIFTCTTLPTAHPAQMYHPLLARLTPEMIEESLVLLRTRATYFKVEVAPTEMKLEPLVCGSPAHFFRMHFLIVTH